jgi:hypothetical protein
MEREFDLSASLGPVRIVEAAPVMTSVDPGSFPVAQVV